jgi:Putative MetA-pathway of phenol degradation
VGIKSNFYGIVFMLSIIAAGPVPSKAQGSALAADANAPAPDKSQYTLFNPTPDSQMRSFCTDRPTKSSSPCTVDAGHFQYESDGFNWTYNHNGSVTQNTYLFTNPTFKLGLTNRIDFQINIAPLVEINTHDKTAHTSTDLTGAGDLFLRTKYNLMGNEGGDLAMTLFPYVKIPTAPPGIGNKAVEEGLIVPIAYSLPHGFSLTLDPEVDAFRNANNGDYHPNYQGLVNIGHSITDTVSGAVELWADNNRDPSGTVAQVSFDAAATWLARPNLQFDVGANVGLNRATPDFQGYFGISQRF